MFLQDEDYDLKESINGFELSDPAKSLSEYRAELAGSAPSSG